MTDNDPRDPKRNLNPALFVVAGVLAGCGHVETGDDIQPLEAEVVPLDEHAGQLTYEEAREQVEADLQALEDLEIFEVQGMFVSHEMMPGSCYGPCADDDERRAKYVEQAARLHALREIADESDPSFPCYIAPDEPSVIEDNLDAIEGLDIVTVGEFLSVEAQPEPNCYNLPCPGEEEAARQATFDRANRLWQIAEKSKEL